MKSATPKGLTKRGAQAPLLGSKLQLKIEKLAIGGAGVARHEGLVVFVPMSAPDEVVLAEVTLVKKNFLEARILEVLTPSPSRRPTPCPVANICGGCNWQHIEETEQRNQKEKLVFESIRKFNRDISFSYLPIRPSPRSFRYRNRIQPKFKDPHFGFFARNSHEIVEITDCLITEEPLTARFAEVSLWAKNRKAKGLQRLEIYLDDQEKVRFGPVDEEDDGVGFSQVNRYQNEDLLATVLSWAGESSYKNIFDLYAGSGNFTFPLAQKFKGSSVTGVELNSKLVAKARANIHENRIAYANADVDSYLKDASIGGEDLVVLDPPRAGASEFIMRALAKARPKKIIYISCHPVSLARDLAWFFAYTQKSGSPMKLLRVQAFEMFPQTDHVETIAELGVDS